MDLKEILDVLKRGYSIHPGSSVHKSVKALNTPESKIVSELLDEGHVIKPDSASHNALKSIKK